MMTIEVLQSNLGIDLDVVAADAHLGAITRFPSHRRNHHRVIRDLRDFHLEESVDETHVGATENQFRSTAGGVDVQKQAPNALARHIVFSRDPFAVRQNGLCLADFNDQVATLATTNDSGHQVTHLVAEFIVNHFLLELAEALLDRLLGGFRRDAP